MNQLLSSTKVSSFSTINFLDALLALPFLPYFLLYSASFAVFFDLAALLLLLAPLLLLTCLDFLFLINLAFFSSVLLLPSSKIK